MLDPDLEQIGDDILPLSISNLAFYKETLATIFRLSEAEMVLDEERLMGISAYFLVRFGGKTASEATQICGKNRLNFLFRDHVSRKIDENRFSY
ncbi:hypothetical protein [Listeria aquatica]|uniref:hypothetical protein n=1 Tax=Listeria aquatica TaxID=1494960 RepID=UPI0031F5545A